MLRYRALPVEDGPLMREYVWLTALKIMGRGSLDYRPIPLSEIEKHFSSFPRHVDVFIDSSMRKLDLGPLKREIARLRNLGETELRPPSPGPDRKLRSGWVWEMYSDQQLLARTKAVYEGALQGYQQLVETWFSRFADRLGTWAYLPARLVGTVVPAVSGQGLAGEPWMRWYLDPLPYESRSYVDLALATEGTSIKAPAHDEMEAKFHRYRPRIAVWPGITVHSGVLHIYDPDSASRLAYRWLWEDLSRISLVKGIWGE